MKKEFKKGDKVLIETTIAKEWSDYNTLGVNAGTDNIAWIDARIVKHAEPEFIPRDMMVWNNSENCATKRKIIGVFGTYLLTENEDGGINGYRYGKEIPKEVKLEAGKWYKSLRAEKTLFFMTSKDDCQFNGYGIQYDGNWTNNAFIIKDKNRLIEATDQEVESALIDEAKKRGFKEGVYFKTASFTGNKFFITNSLKYNSEYNVISQSGAGEGQIFNNGIWAKIIEVKKMSKSEIEYELGYKIEIV